MKFRCERDVLVEALGTASRGTASRGALLVLSGAKLELAGDRLRITGTDLDLTLQVDVTVQGGGEGTCVVPARLATDIVRAFEAGAVSFDAGDDEARLSSGRSQFTVRTLPTDEFPRLGPPAEHVVTLAAGDFVEALRQVVPAASHDDARPILTGVLLAAEEGGLRLVATDSYRLAVRDLPGASVLQEGQKVLVPSRALNELTRALGNAEQVTLRLGEREATFETEGVSLTTRLIEGEFPNYRQLIPSGYPNRLTVSRAALLDAVRRVKILAPDVSTPVKLTLYPDRVELTVSNQDQGQAREEVDAKFEGTEMTVAFNPNYLIDGMEAVAGDEVVLETLDALKPATLRPTDGVEYLYLLMPVRVS